MRLSKSDIRTIQSKRKAKEGITYTDFSGNTYIGTSVGTLKLLNSLDVKQSKGIKSNNVSIENNRDSINDLQDELDDLKEDVALKEYTTDVDAKLKKLECKLIAFNIVM
jgi:hypothetical protein